MAAFVLLSALPSEALAPSRLAWRSIGKREGFSGGAVSDILQDRKGLIWIGSSSGLYRYDGQDFVEYRTEQGLSSVANSSVNSILEDGYGHIWVSSDGGGLSRYDPERRSFVPFSLSGDAMPEPEVTAMASGARESILLGTAQGDLFELGVTENGDMTKLASFSSPITCLVADSKGNLWIGTEADGAFRCGRDSGAMLRVGLESADRASRDSSGVTAMIEDSLGFIWIGYGDGAIESVEGGAASSSTVVAGDPSRFGVRALAEDIRGQVWVSFGDGNVGVLDPSAKELEDESFTHGVEATALMRDRRGLMWIGLARGGLLTGDMRSANFVRYESGGGKPMGSIVAILEPAEDLSLSALPQPDALAVSQESVMYAYYGDKDAFVPIGRILQSPARVTSVAPGPKGSLWIGTAGHGLLLARAGKEIRRFLPVPGDPASIISSTVLRLFADEDGVIWVGTDRGLDRFDPATGDFVHIGPQREAEAVPHAGTEISAVARDADGNYWIGTLDGGLARLDSLTGTLRKAPGEGRTGIGIPDNRIECLFIDSRNILWVGTGGSGLFGYDVKAGAVIHRGADHGLPAEAFYAVAEDGAGRLWAAGASGLFTFDLERRESFLYGPEDGIGEGGLESGALARSPEGPMWLGRGSGATRFDPARIARYAPAPDVVITDLSPMDDGYTAELSLDGAEITLPYNNAGLGFSIAVVDYTAPGRNRYAMRLEGRQTGWTPMGGNNRGYLAALQPGKYMLRVKASNGNGVWNNYGASLSIVVKTPWWAEWWLSALGIFAVVAIVGGTIAARVNALRRRNAVLVRFAAHIDEAREEERKIAARDVHDEIGQHLMVLNFQTYWLSSHPRASIEERTSVVKEMQGTIGKAMDSVKAIATRFRPGALDTLDFPDALNWYLRSFSKMSGIKSELHVQEAWRELSSDTARVMFRLLQEALSNVARHSEAGSVLVEFGADRDHFKLTVADDGKGMPKGRADAQDSFGIIGMRETCAGLGGSLTIDSEAGKGCTVIAALPRSPSGERIRAKPLPWRRRRRGKDGNTHR